MSLGKLNGTGIVTGANHYGLGEPAFARMEGW